MSSEDQYVEHSYLTDDRDKSRRAELVVAWAPNGDYYVGSRPEGDRILMNSVRICTRGGASSVNPKLVKAVADLFQALGGWEPDQRKETLQSPKVSNDLVLRPTQDVIADLKELAPQVAADSEERDRRERQRKRDIANTIF